MQHYDRDAICRMQFRQFRKRMDLADSPYIAAIDRAAARLGVHCRADTGAALRAYIWRKQCALARHYQKRSPMLAIVNHGREFRAPAMGA